ncbi:hypothetical protein LINGRAHAP2_LOCUS27375, partial [Linum grandiflorum]
VKIVGKDDGELESRSIRRNLLYDSTVATMGAVTEGVRIHGNVLRNFAAVIQKRITVGSIYKIFEFTLRAPRPTYRTCRFPHWLAFTAVTKFELQPPTDNAFTDEVLEYVPLGKFPSRMPPCAYVTNFVVKLIIVGKLNYIDMPSGASPVQNITVVDARLMFPCGRSELSSVIDADTVVLDDVANPSIVAFAGFWVHLYHGKGTTSSTLCSRVFLDPTDSYAEKLRTNYLIFLFFTLNARPITYVPPKFDIPEKLKQHLQALVRTVEELLTMYVAGGDALMGLPTGGSDHDIVLTEDVVYSLPARHDTPIPPDPAYVPPVSIGVPLFDVLAESSFTVAATTSDGDASHQTLPQDAPAPPIVTKFVPVFLIYPFLAPVCSVLVFSSSSLQTCNMSRLEKARNCCPPYLTSITLAAQCAQTCNMPSLEINNAIQSCANRCRPYSTVICFSGS